MRLQLLLYKIFVKDLKIRNDTHVYCRLCSILLQQKIYFFRFSIRFDFKLVTYCKGWKKIFIVHHAEKTKLSMTKIRSVNFFFF